jgi:hypothetical protein
MCRNAMKEDLELKCEAKGNSMHRCILSSDNTGVYEEKELSYTKIKLN